MIDILNTEAVQLNDTQIALLFSLTEKQLLWSKVYHEEPPNFNALLELNHHKLSYKVTDNMTEDDITNILKDIENSYDNLINYYNNYK